MAARQPGCCTCGGDEEPDTSCYEACPAYMQVSISGIPSEDCNGEVNCDLINGDYLIPCLPFQALHQWYYQWSFNLGHSCYTSIFLTVRRPTASGTTKLRVSLNNIVGTTKTRDYENYDSWDCQAGAQSSWTDIGGTGSFPVCDLNGLTITVTPIPA